jgi:hypothetical protein
MQNCEPLLWFGAIVIIVTGSLVLIPNLMGKTGLMSGWNILLVGLAIYLGLGSFEAATTPMQYYGLEWFEPQVAEVTWFLWAAFVFLAVLIITYYYNPVARYTAKAFNKWPPLTTPMYLFVIACCGVVVAAVPLAGGVAFFSNVAIQVSHKALIFATVFMFLLWLRDRTNFLWLVLFLMTFFAAVVLAMYFATGRRLLLSVFLAPVACIYMHYVRMWRPSRAMVVIGVAAFGLLVVGFMYNSFRRFNKGDPSQERSIANLIDEASRVNEHDWWGEFSSDVLRKMAQSNVKYSLFTQRMVDTGQLEPKPLNTLAFLVSYPIPREFWPEKPTVLAVTIVHDVLGRTRTNWGAGVVAHPAYEGGILVGALYAFLIAIAIRFLDDPLKRQPTNPFLIATFASAAPHILAFPRGDFGTMAIETIECFLFAGLLLIGARILFGTDRSSASAYRYAPPPALRYGRAIR